MDWDNNEEKGRYHINSFPTRISLNSFMRRKSNRNQHKKEKELPTRQNSRYLLVMRVLQGIESHGPQSRGYVYSSLGNA